MFRPNRLTTLTMLVWLWSSGATAADGLLDGRVFAGMIGPADHPDLADNLHFSNGHFWSDICTRCGFLPGAYRSERTDGGIVFRGVLESNSRGQFEYEGLVHDDGTIDVSILWERERWYWTSSREISFQGAERRKPDAVTLSEMRMKMDDTGSGTDPLCARF